MKIHAFIPAKRGARRLPGQRPAVSGLPGQHGLDDRADRHRYLHCARHPLRSFIHPLTILTALPFAGFGALPTLFLFHTELSLYAFVGIIMLVGLVKKNGIMMIDFAVAAQRAEGKRAQDAIHDAGVIRFRPIMMTTMAALMAGLPIALGYGAGAESRRPLGLAVVGGLLFSQTLTLYVIPGRTVAITREAIGECG